MSSKKREFDKPSHSGTGRLDTSKKGGHRGWGTDQDQMAQGQKDYANNKGGQGGPQGGGYKKNYNNKNDPETARELNQMGNEEKDNSVSFETFQKQNRSVKVQPYTVHEKKGIKGQKKRVGKRTAAQKVTDSLFVGEYNNSNRKGNKKNRNNRKGGQGGSGNQQQQGGNNKNKNKNKNKNNKNLNQNAQKQKNRKAKEVLMTSVSYEAPDSRYGGRGRGRGNRGGYGRTRGGRGYRGSYGSYGGSRGNFGWRGRGGGFGSRGRGRRMQDDLNGNKPNANPNQHGQHQQHRQSNQSQHQQPRQQQYRKVDPQSKGQNQSNA